MASVMLGISREAKILSGLLAEDSRKHSIHVLHMI